MSIAARWLIAFALVVLVGASYRLDAHDDATTAQLVAADKADAIKDARRRAQHGVERYAP